MNEKNKDSKFLDTIYKSAEAETAQLKQDIKKSKKSKIKAPALQGSAQNAKESKFFDAINRDAAKHMEQINQEIADFKNAKIEQATEQGLNDAYELMREDVAGRRAAIINSVSRKKLELKNTLYAERQKIRDYVFDRAEAKLRAFTETDDYTRFLTDSVRRIADVIGGDNCIVYIAPADENKRGLISELIAGAEIAVDNHILIGGVRVVCSVRGIVLDDTLDTRLSDQYAWFNENSGLKVV